MQNQKDLFAGFVTHEQHMKVVGLDFIANAHYPFEDVKKLIFPGEKFSVLSLQKDLFICATNNEYFVINAKDLKLIVTSHDTTVNIPDPFLRAVSTMNFMLLRNLFKFENPSDEILAREVKDFFFELPKSPDMLRNRFVKKVFSDELRDGEYFEDLSISETRQRFHRFFVSSLYDPKDADMMTDYYMSLIPEEAAPRTDDVAYGSTDVYQIKPADRTAQVKVSLNQEHGNEDFPDHTEVLVWLEVDGKDASDVSSIFVKTS